MGSWVVVHRKERNSSQIKLTVYKVPGEINTDDLSPATDAWSRPEYLYMLWQCLKCQEKDWIDR